MVAAGSLAATPTRTVPTSTAIRAPCLMPPAQSRDIRLLWLISRDRRWSQRSLAGGDPFAHAMAYGGQRVVDRVGLASATLRDVIAPAATAAECLRGDADEVTGRQTPFAASVVDRHHDDRPAVVDRGGRHDAGTVADAATHVQRELAQVVGPGAVRCAVCDDGHAELVRRRRHEIRRLRQDRCRAGSLELLLQLAHPRDERADSVDELLGPRLQRLGQLRHEQVLAGEEPVGVRADETLDATHAGTDRRLAEQLDETELRRAGGVRAAAELAG